METNKVNSNYKYAQIFNSDVVSWRQTAAKLWSLLLVFGLVLFHSVTSIYSPLTEFSSFTLGFVLNIFTFSFWLYASLILATFWLLFSFNDNLFRVTPKVYANNLDKLLHILYSFHSVCILSNVAGSIFSAFLLLKFYDSEMPIQRVSVCMFCALSSLILKFQFTLEDRYLLNWPIIEQTKYFRFKSMVYSLVLKQFKDVLFHMVVWKVINFLIGSCMINVLFQTLPSTPVSTFQTTLVSLKLSLILNVSQSLAWLIYEIYMTELYHFNVQPNVNSALCLPASMSLNTHAYIQTLAFLDLVNASVYSKTKRRQIFSLSYASNQPVNWIKISTEALNLIRGFIEVFSFDDMLHGKVSLPQLQTPTRFAGTTLRRTINVTSPLRDTNNQISNIKSPLKEPAKSVEAAVMNSFSQKVMSFLKKQRFFAHFYKENTNYKTEQLFVDSFLVINALKGLSNLVMCSYTEDEYGIVQQTLPDIISTFIDLQKILEKFNPSNSSTTVNFKVLQRVDATKIELLMQKLTFILNESMFKITQTFGSSLNSLTLSEEALYRMKRFHLA